MIFDYLIKKINEHKSYLERQVLQGHLEDFNSYRYLTGKIIGLQEAIEICDEVIRKGKDE